MNELNLTLPSYLKPEEGNHSGNSLAGVPPDAALGHTSLTYSIPQAAQLMGVSVRTMYTLAHKKGFPCIRLTPNRIVISRAGLEAWMQEQINCKGGDN